MLHLCVISHHVLFVLAELYLLCGMHLPILRFRTREAQRKLSELINETFPNQLSNEMGRSHVGAIPTALKAQSFQNMP